MKRLVKTLVLLFVVAIIGFLSTSAVAHADVGVSGDMNGDGYNDTAVINTNGHVAIFHGPGYWNQYCRCLQYWTTDYYLTPNWRSANTQRTTYNNNMNIVVNYVAVSLSGASVSIVDDEMRTVRFYNLPYWDAYVPGPGNGAGVVDPTYLRAGLSYTTVTVVNDVRGGVYATNVKNGYDSYFLQDVTGDGMKDIVFHYNLGCDVQGCHQGWSTFDANADRTIWYQV